jgi:hypothetical protein
MSVGNLVQPWKRFTATPGYTASTSAQNIVRVHVSQHRTWLGGRRTDWFNGGSVQSKSISSAAWEQHVHGGSVDATRASASTALAILWSHLVHITITIGMSP